MLGTMFTYKPLRFKLMNEMFFEVVSTIDNPVIYGLQ